MNTNISTNNLINNIDYFDLYNKTIKCYNKKYMNEKLCLNVIQIIIDKIEIIEMIEDDMYKKYEELCVKMIELNKNLNNDILFDGIKIIYKLLNNNLSKKNEKIQNKIINNYYNIKE